MPHTLWQSHNWQNASIEAVITALFDVPEFIDPCDMAKIQQYHPTAIREYQKIFYRGDIPDYAAKPKQ
ncbi:hypothetical protein [Crocosphaera chwakensis]|uniref:Uncharacterized protein n=1 Tax=Crocosphaera chwakensis CCY0110 TaxID=391612 RepID=A3IS48_9CHRO|nr:hypothetical protein [Crocosphaera chwakensis]EAZ90726.1 hypothetical protein CY0110_32300 [Crocosphaera chwakensis CCY0110]